MPTFTCPRCEEEIDHVRYAQSVREYGHANLTLDNSGNPYVADYETDDSEGQGDENLFCPECDDEISLDELLIDRVAEEEDAPTPIPPDAGETGNASAVRSAILEGSDQKIHVARCPDCDWEGPETYRRCPSCDAQTTVVTL